MSSRPNYELLVIQPLHTHHCHILFTFDFRRTQILFLVYYMQVIFGVYKADTFEFVDI